MPTRTIDPRERQIIDHLIALGIGAARQTFFAAQRSGYTPEAIQAILEHYAASSLTDPATGETVPAWNPGQLVLRLRDEDAVGHPAHLGKWGGKSAAWSALKLRLETQPMATPAATTIPHKRTALIESLSRAQAIQLLEQLISWLTDRQQPTDRVAKCLAWCQTAPDWSIVPPANVQKFLRAFPIETLPRPTQAATPTPPRVPTKPTPAQAHLTSSCHRCQRPCAGNIVSLGRTLCDACYDQHLSGCDQ